MKITFLGTSHGIPSADRFCSCTLLETGGKLYAIDAGVPLYDLLLRNGKRTEDLRAIFTTHFHGDHIGGVHQTADTVNWANREGQLQVFLTERKALSLIRALIEGGSGKKLERTTLSMVKRGVFYKDENIRVTAYPTGHLAHAHRPAFSFLVEAEEKKVFFTGDLSAGLAQKDFPSYLLNRKTDLAVCELAHFTPEQADPYLKACKTKRLLFNHVYPDNNFQKIVALGNTYGYPTGAVRDGDEIIL